MLAQVNGVLEDICVCVACDMFNKLFTVKNKEHHLDAVLERRDVSLK